LRPLGSFWGVSVCRIVNIRADDLDAREPCLASAARARCRSLRWRQSASPAFAERNVMERGSTAASVWLDTRRLDHPGPLLGLIGDKLSEVGGRSGQHGAAQIGEARLDLGIGEASVDVLVELIDQGVGRSFRRVETDPARPITRIQAVSIALFSSSASAAAWTLMASPSPLRLADGGLC